MIFDYFQSLHCDIWFSLQKKKKEYFLLIRIGCITSIKNFPDKNVLKMVFANVREFLMFKPERRLFTTNYRLGGIYKYGEN